MAARAELAASDSSKQLDWRCQQCCLWIEQVMYEASVSVTAHLHRQMLIVVSWRAASVLPPGVQVPQLRLRGRSFIPSADSNSPALRRQLLPRQRPW